MLRITRREVRLVGAAFGIVAALAAAGHAQNVQHFKPAPGTWNYFTVDSARVARHGEFVPSLVINYGHEPLVARDANDKIVETIVGSLWMADVQLAVGIKDFFEISVSLPFGHADGQRLAGTGDDGWGIGDVRVVPKFRLYGAKDGRGFGLAIVLPVELPSGDETKFIGSGQVVANPKLVLEARMDGFSVAANGGARFRPSREGVGDLEVGHEVTYGAGVGVDLGTDIVTAIGEVYGAAAISDVQSGSRANPLEALIGVRIFTPPGAVFTVAGGSGLVPDYGSPLWRVIFGFAWHDRNLDRDGDGIPDSEDKCPDDPEDKDGFQDVDGCPDPDNDADGILDVNDLCPNDPEDIDGFQDEDGCPDPDNDGDGILDVDDKCPNEPETFNGFQDADGCPDDALDTDKDGIPDHLDKCPLQPEDFDGFQDADGCPDPDNDGDGILDVNDKCPNEPETVNGYQDEDGCPDEGPTLVKVTKGKIEILQKVFFDTNKDTIKSVSFPVLDEVSKVLIGNPNIKRVRVEGHTDSRGNAQYNKALSQRRAESVRRYLMSRGVEAERLDAVGYGMEQPIDTNKTAGGRDNNRRVEFTILGD